MEFFSQKLWENDIYLLQNTAFSVLSTWPQQCKTKKKILPHILLRTIYHYLAQVFRMLGGRFGAGWHHLAQVALGGSRGLGKGADSFSAFPVSLSVSRRQSDVGCSKLFKLGKMETTLCCFFISPASSLGMFIADGTLLTL